MSSRKYTKDYRLENKSQKNGKVVTIPVYRGELFGFEKKKEDVERVKRVFLIFTIAEWVIYFVALLLNTDKGRVMYVSLPLIAVAFPLLGQTSIVLMLKKTKSEYIRSEKDKITEKLISWVFVSFFFSLCSLLGHVVSWIMRGESILDAILLVLTLLLVALSYSLFAKRKDLAMKMVGTTKLPEEEDQK